MNFDILMPFHRSHNAQAIRDSFESACVGLKGKARLVSVCTDKAHVGLFEDSILVLPRPGWDICYWKLNQALNQIIPISEHEQHYIGFFCDDDLWEPSFFTHLETAAESKMHRGQPPAVLAVSMNRHYHKPDVQDVLAASPENVRVGLIGLEQFYVRADVMEQYRFVNLPHADGDLVERLVRDRHHFEFVPNLFANWNKLPA